MNTDIKAKLTTYINQKRDAYGYSATKGNYDLEASSYYTNILNILEGADDIGLR